MIFFRKKTPPAPPKEEKKVPKPPAEDRILTAEGWKRLNLKKVRKAK